MRYNPRELRLRVRLRQLRIWITPLAQVRYPHRRGFLKRKLGSRDYPLTAESVREFVEDLQAQDALRDWLLHGIYFYDAPRLRSSERKPLAGENVKFAETPLARNNERLHQDLRSMPFVALRIGDLRFRGWTLNVHRLPPSQSELTITSDDLVPNVHQTGVDMRVGLDIASLALKKHVDAIVLVTADSDFVPAMKFARREGAQLFLVPLGHRIVDEMREHADLILDID